MYKAMQPLRKIMAEKSATCIHGGMQTCGCASNWHHSEQNPVHHTSGISGTQFECWTVQIEQPGI